MTTKPAGTRALSDSRVVLAVLTLCYAANFADRTVINTLGEAIKLDLGLSDMQLGLLGGLSFAFLYAASTLPIARLSDRFSRVRIMTIAITFWSAATMLCGAATSFASLLMFRAAVGVGEAGCSPPAQSLIADYFPRARRAFAISIFYLGVPIGAFLGAVVGGALATHYGWRMAFLVVGAPGLLLALLLWVLVREPPRGRFDAAPDLGAAPPLTAVLRALWATPGLRYVVAGTTLAGFLHYSFAQFLHPFFVRVFDLPYGTAALAYGFIAAGGAAIGTPVGGVLSDRLGRGDPRWAAWLPGVGFLIAAPIYVAGVLQSSWLGACGCLFLASIFSNFYHGPTFASVHNRIPSRMRATAAAVMMFASVSIGMGLGPMIVGFASDLFASRAFTGDYGACRGGEQLVGAACAQASAVGIRSALALTTVFALLAAAAYGLAGRRLGSETDI